MMPENEEKVSKWQLWLQSGKLAAILWGLVFLAYLWFRFKNINAPELTNAFVTITGVMVGNLGISQITKKAETTARQDNKIDHAEKKAEHADKKADHAVSVAENAKDTVDTATGGIPVIREEDLHDNPPRLYRGEGDHGA